MLVEGFESLENLKCDFPNKSFFKSFSIIIFKSSINFALKVSPIGILHNNT